MELKLSREEVGKSVGACVYAVRNWENNISSPNRRYHTAIIKFLGYDPKVKAKEFYGDKICEHLKLHEITQKEFAARVGVSPQLVYKWMHNLSSPPAIFLAKLWVVLGKRSEQTNE